MPSLLNPNLKVERAKTHLDVLDGRVADFTRPDRYRVSPSDDLEAGQYVVVLENDFPPLDLGTIAGDFINNLRSALDHLAWQLAALTTATPSRDLCFPICGTYSVSTEEYIRKCTSDFPTEAVSVVQSFQPYNSGNAYRETHLWRLNFLWNVDKHRYITLRNSSIELNFPRMPVALAPTTEIIDERGIVRFPLAAKQYMDFPPQVRMDVGFGDDSKGVLLTIRDFRDMYKFVSETVIPAFSGFFSEPPILRQRPKIRYDE